MAAADGEYEAGGIGGKFRRRPFRRTAAATPYERPFTADRTLRHRTGLADRSGWISKIVDPASRLISSGASLFFASIFRKRIGAPPSHSSTQHAVSSTIQESQVTDTEKKDQLADEVHAQDVVTDMETTKEEAAGATISHVEQLIKQKTFTRAEHDRLVDLLQSRTANFSEEKDLRTEPSSFAAQDGKKENLRGITKLTGIITRTSPSKMRDIVQISEEEPTSPTELAKVYMGSRPSQVACPTSSLRYATLGEDTSHTTLQNTQVTRSQAKKSAVPRPNTFFSRNDEEKCRISRAHGRTAIYKMSQSPYFKSRKGTEPNGKGYALLPASEHSTSSLSASKQGTKFQSDGQVLKRRSMYVDDDSASLGSSRRVRQKFSKGLPLKENLLTSERFVSSPYTNALQGYTTPVQKSLLTSVLNHDISLAEDIDKSSFACFASVPQQSSLMARKILQQLDHVIPSSKEKMKKLKGDDESPSKLTLDMLNGRALTSLNDLDSSRFLQTEGNVQYSCISPPRTSSVAPSVEMHNRIESNVFPGPQTSGGKRLSNVVNGACVPIGNKPGIVDGNFTFSNSSPTLKTSSFRMQVPESSWESDSDDFVVASDHECEKKNSSKLSIIEANNLTVKLLPHHSSGKRLDGGSSTVKESVNGVTSGTTSFEKDKLSNVSLASSIGGLAHIPPASLMEDEASKVKKAFPESVSTQGQLFDQSISQTELPSSPSTSKNGSAFIFGNKTTSNAFSFSSGTSLECKPVFPVCNSSTLLTNKAEIFSYGKDKETKIARESIELTSPGPQTCSIPIASTPMSGASNLILSKLSLPITSVSPLSDSLGTSRSTPSTTFSTIPPLSLQENGSDIKAISTSVVTSNVSICNKEVERPIKESAFGTISFSVSTETPSLSSSGSRVVGSNVSLPSVVSSSAGQTGSGTSFVKEKSTSQFMSSNTSFTGTSASSSFGVTGSVIGSSEVVATPFSFGSKLNVDQSLPCDSSLSISQSQPTAAPIFSFGFTSASGQGSGATLSSSTSSSTLSFTSPSSSSIFSSNSQSLIPSIFSSGFGSCPGASSSTPFTASAPTLSTSASSHQAEASVFGSYISSGCGLGSSISFSASASASKSSSNSSLASPPSSLGLFSSSSQNASAPMFSSSGKSSPVSFGSGIFSSSGSSPFSSTLNSPNLFNSSNQPASSSTFGSGSSLTTGFSFGLSSASATNVPFSFGSSSSSPFSFSAGITSSTSSSLSPSVPSFGMTAPVTFGASMPANDQMNEDSMTDDTVQMAAPIISPFGQVSASTMPSVTFGSPALQTGGATGFQFGNQMNSVFSQGQSSFQAGGSFSLGSGGGDKSNRRIVKVKRDKHRKK